MDDLDHRPVHTINQSLGVLQTREDSRLKMKNSLTAPIVYRVETKKNAKTNSRI